MAHFKCTVLLLLSGTVWVTGLELPGYFKTEKTPDKETAKILANILRWLPRRRLPRRRRQENEQMKPTLMTLFDASINLEVLREMQWH